MSSLIRTLCVLLPSAGLAALPAAAQTTTEIPLGETVERHLTGDEVPTPWVIDEEYLATEQGDTLAMQEVDAEALETVKLTNLVPPIHFESGVAEIPDSTVVELNAILASMRERRNVRLHLVGHADNQPLSDALAAIYGDNEGLSRERAGEVAELLKETLALPPEAIAYEWAGDTQPVASNETLAGRALNRRVEVEIWYDEVKATTALEEYLVQSDFSRIKVCRMQTVCKLSYIEGQARRARVQNLIAPLRFDEDAVDVTPRFIDSVRQALANLSDKQNVVVRFVGYTDDQPLSGRAERIYGTQVGLSQSRARRAALAVQEELGLPTAAIESDGRGPERPLGSNATPQGRALNRRIEVEFWYDDPLQELPDEPQLCPSDLPGTVVTKIYDPPWGELPPVLMEDGTPSIPADLEASIARALADLSDREHVRVRFVGYTRNERLERRTAAVYGDDVGLSAARARRTMEIVATDMGLAPEQVEFEGRGFVYSPDVVNAGFIQGETSEIVAEVLYDDFADNTDLDGIEITPLTRELRPQNPFSLNMMRITVDGDPIDDPDRSFADVQRCTDVALDEAAIQFGFDNLRAARRLSVSAEPTRIRLVQSGASLQAETSVTFSMYTNYSHFLDHAEVRIFDVETSVHDTPLAVVPIPIGGMAQWLPSVEASRLVTPFRELKLVLRAYDASGAYDETTPRPLWLTRRVDSPLTPTPPQAALLELPGGLTGLPLGAGFGAGLSGVGVSATAFGAEAAASAATESLAAVAAESVAADTSTGPAGEPGSDAAAVIDAVISADLGAGLEADADAEAAAGGAELPSSPVLLQAYGEDTLAVRGIPLGSGTVTVHGDRIPEGHTVWVAGQQVPVDASGKFVAEAILPTGLHTVEVAVLDEQGNGELFLRDLELERNDWFYVGMADLTLAQNDTTGPIELLQGENSPVDLTASSYGRLAFYVNGKFGDRWKLAASADTREEPLDSLFSNFMNKSPDSLFRRIDPDYRYPTFGDDSTVTEGAPTLGRMYVKLERGENYGVWGNFNVGYLNNELAHVDRGLYGGTLHYGSERRTGFGEQRLGVDGFAAEPGTIGSREEFRGTGGSLYFLRQQDILTGSERVRVELRDKASGIVTGVMNLRPVLDYDIDYLQGRILLTEPLNSTAADGLLVRSGSLDGNEAYLVVRYEYTPGFDEIDAMSVGGQVHYWVNDFVKIGLTANTNEQGDTDSTLSGADVTVRKSEQTWLKLQSGETEGFLTRSVRSDDGGFEFFGYDDISFVSAAAGASRVDVSVGLNDFFDATRGRLNVYTQELEAGYAAPGLATLTDTHSVGAAFTMPITERLSVTAKADTRDQEQVLETEARELDVDWQMNDNWKVSSGLRQDLRRDTSPLAPLTQEEGERRDAVVQVGYDSLAKWSAYGFVQDTLDVTGNREENGRLGVGSAYRISEQLSIDMEVSDGDLGPGGKLGTNYMPTERTSLYLNYALENERTDNGLRSSRGSQGRFVAGARTRFSDSASVFLEERYNDSGGLTGLTHSAGISFAPTARLNLSANTDVGTLRDVLTGAETKRTAAGVQAGYGFSAVQFSTGMEYRTDDIEQPDLGIVNRTTWLFRNSFKYEMSPAMRLLGKLNHSASESTQGQFYDGGFTEAVVGFAFRPVTNDRLNALAKYTYFYNVPTTGQVTLKGTATEFIQKSHITSVDVTYDIKPRWTIGGKYAYRLGEVSFDRENPQFFDNGAQLYVLRADWEFKKDWEAMFETRLLDMSDIGDHRSGSVIVVSRYLGSRLKIGAGYNFTSFTDDLTDLSFDHRGAFLNLTGAM